jgi:hypothetical protein
MEGLNQIAPPGAVVEVVGPWRSAAIFARPDLVVFKSGADDAGSYSPAYLMVLTRSNGDQRMVTGGPPILQIAVAGATLAEVRLTGEEP